jgi:CheY-like chemotaxis protein
MNKPATTEGLEAALRRMKDFAATKVRRLLVVEDNPAEQLSITELLGSADLKITVAGSGAEALSALREASFDCVVLDLHLPDMSGFDLLDEVKKLPMARDLPVVVFTGRDLNEQEDGLLRLSAKSIVLKGVRSPERLLDETALFLHRVIRDLPESRQRMIETLHQGDELLHGRKILVVDDDVRNIFALNSVLERHKMDVVSATTGQGAIDLLENSSDIALVLMDVMMPEMDGYETMRRIRNKTQYRMLPIIALTAKAMQGDREKCLEAGASDYVAKPVNTEQLLSLVRMWLHR